MKKTIADERAEQVYVKALEAYRREHDGRLLQADERDRCDCAFCVEAEAALAEMRQA